MNEEISLTINQLYGIFMAGREFERGETLVDTDEIDENKYPDFDKYMRDTHQVILVDSEKLKKLLGIKK